MKWWENVRTHVSKIDEIFGGPPLATDVHQGEFVDFKMKVVRRHQSALFRQVHEAVWLNRISQDPGVKVLNSKGEYNRCKLPRLQVAEEFKDPNKLGDGGVKYTLPSKQNKAKPNDNRWIILDF